MAVAVMGAPTSPRLVAAASQLVWSMMGDPPGCPQGPGSVHEPAVMSLNPPGARGGGGGA